MMSTMQMPMTMGDGTRIPESLKAIFLASNGGQDIGSIDAPPATIAMQMFERNSHNAHDAAQLSHEEMMKALLNMNNDFTIQEEDEEEEEEGRGMTRIVSMAQQNNGRVVSFHDFENFHPSGNNLNNSTSRLHNPVGSDIGIVSHATLFDNYNASFGKQGGPATAALGPASAALGQLSQQGAASAALLQTLGSATAASLGSNANYIGSSPSLLALAEQAKKLSPQEHLDDILQSRGYSTKTYASLQTAYYNTPTELQTSSYDLHLIELVRRRDLKALKDIFKAGISLNPCNSHSESLLHTVCRLGFTELLQFLVVSRGASVQVCDDYGKTPMHDACWTATPNFPVVEILLRKDRRLFQLLDVRGMSPLAYVPKDSYPAWIEWLEAKKDVYFPFRGHVDLVGEEPAPVLATQPFNSRPMPDPVNALKPRLATMLVSGKMSVKEIEFLKSDEAALSCMTLDFDGGEWDSDLESEFDSDEEDSYQGSFDSEDDEDYEDNDDDDMSLSVSIANMSFRD